MTGTGHSHDAELITTFSLHPYIDHNQSYCLNESIPNSGVKTLRPHSERFLPRDTAETTPVTVTSDPHDPDDTEDVELLLHVKFNEAVNISSMCVCGRGSLAEVSNGSDDTRRTAAPWKCKVFANRTDLDFDMARELKGDVELELLPPEHSMENGEMTETIDFPIRGRKLQYCNNVTLFFGENYSSLLEEDEVVPTEITFVGFKGEGTTVKCIPVTAVYESRGMTKDHKVPGGELGGRHFI